MGIPDRIPRPYSTILALISVVCLAVGIAAIDLRFVWFTLGFVVGGIGGAGAQKFRRSFRPSGHWQDSPPAEWSV
jgi:hypothetical protein